MISRGCVEERDEETVGEGAMLKRATTEQSLVDVVVVVAVSYGR